MIPSRVAITLLLLVAVVLTVAGCLVASVNNGKPTAPSLPVTAIGSTLTTAPPPSIRPTLSIYDQPSVYWIKIDPISDKQVGEIFTINSTTNLSVGDEILVQVYQANYRTGIHNPMEEFHGIASTVKVMPGRNEINTISFIVNSSELYPDPRKYSFYETAINENATGEARFNITPRKTS